MVKKSEYGLHGLLVTLNVDKIKVDNAITPIWARVTWLKVNVTWQPTGFLRFGHMAVPQDLPSMCCT